MNSNMTSNMTSSTPMPTSKLAATSTPMPWVNGGIKNSDFSHTSNSFPVSSTPKVILVPKRLYFTIDLLIPISNDRNI